jgi:16S rRNA (cytosine967-C5)-methyltransferase
VRSNSVSPARLTAFEILRRVEDGAYASVLLASKEETLKPADRALTHELVQGILRRQSFLDHLIQHFSNRSIDSLDQSVRIALRLGLYQLRFLDRIPPSAAVNESVNLTRRARLRSAEGFVNAVLRRGDRERDYDPMVGLTDTVDRLAMETSHPRWLLERWITAFGFDFAAEFARANNQAAPLAFRVVKGIGEESDIVEALKASGGTITRSKVATSAWVLQGNPRKLLELAREGRVYIQDDASQLAAEIVAAEASDRVLDVCAAPGSKTSQVAAADQRFEIIAADVNEARLRTVADTIELHRISNVRCVLMDGLRDFPFKEGSFDTVFVDAPCSGTGTLRRNPEIRWRISAADIQDLSARQSQILSNAAGLVAYGGRLIYSTCSVEPEENEKVLRTFLDSHDEFEQLEPRTSPALLTAEKTIRTWPQVHGSDGFFVGVLRRKAV